MSKLQIIIGSTRPGRAADLAGAALLNTPSLPPLRPATSHFTDRDWRQALWYTGFSVAFFVGAAIVAASAIVSAMLVNAKANDFSNPAASPAFGEG